MYDIVFISYNEVNADDNYQKLKDRFISAKRINGVKGIHQAHIAAAKKCFTKMFWVVDADALIINDFDFSFIAPNHQLDYVYVWRSINPVNDLEYGYGAVKLLPRKMTIDMDLSNPDMTTSISENFVAVPEVSNITSFNTDPYSTWRSAFRECCKLNSKIIKRQNDSETAERLNTWCTVGQDKPFGEYAIDGAICGAKYGEDNKNDLKALSKINDFGWLKERFNEKYRLEK